uniref:HAT C-terminal dimerisation domain-containing protein n=1 Tax=Solanum lycopersicum TaxID=4081 RepID=A0A3Q7I617_SOLLC
MAACITNCLLEWGLDNVFTIIVDNDSSNDVTVKEMSKKLSNWRINIMDGDNLHVRCTEHILNLIVQDGLKEIDVPTRWNSTYSMLDITQHFELTFERYSFYDIGYFNHLRTFGSDSSENKDGTSVEDGTTANILSSVDWKNVRGRMRTKQQFEKHKEVSGSSVNEPRFPILAEMFRDVLAIPISSVASECAFITGGRVLDPF